VFATESRGSDAAVAPLDAPAAAALVVPGSASVGAGVRTAVLAPVLSGRCSPPAQAVAVNRNDVSLRSEAIAFREDDAQALLGVTIQGLADQLGRT